MPPAGPVLSTLPHSRSPPIPICPQPRSFLWRAKSRRSPQQMGLLVPLMIPSTPALPHTAMCGHANQCSPSCFLTAREFATLMARKEQRGRVDMSVTSAPLFTNPRMDFTSLSLSFPHTNYEYQQASRNLQKARRIAIGVPGTARGGGHLFPLPRQILEKTVS